MRSVLERLNTPVAFAVVLALILLANGLLLYWNRSTEDTGQAADGGREVPLEATSPFEKTSGSAQEGEDDEPRAKDSSQDSGPGDGASGSDEAEETSDKETVGERTPVEVEESALLAGLSESVDSCVPEDGTVEECLRSFVREVAPDSSYAGGRIDLAPSGERDTEVLYFQAPELAACEFQRAEHETEDVLYSVVIVGEGSFGAEGGDRCVPQIG